MLFHSSVGRTCKLCMLIYGDEKVNSIDFVCDETQLIRYSSGPIGRLFIVADYRSRLSCENVLEHRWYNNLFKVASFSIIVSKRL